MALKLWLGPAGSGKSHEMYTHILREAKAHPELEYLVIVPEQFTLQTQKNLAMLDERHGILNVDVLSFARLAHRITEEVGGESCKAVLLNDMGKNLILRRVAAEHEDDLLVFGKKLKRLGYITEVKSLISEFMQYGISVQDTQKLSGYASSMGRNFLSGKLDDVALLYKAFLDYISEKYTTTEELMDRVSSLLPMSETISKRVIAFDGFTGFTPVQLKLIEALLTYSKDVYATILTDEVEKYGKISTGAVKNDAKREDFTSDHAAAAGSGSVKGVQKTVESDHALFYMSHRTINQLRNLAKKTGTEEEEPVCLAENIHLKGAEMLSYLEKHLFRDGVAAEGYDGATVLNGSDADTDTAGEGPDDIFANDIVSDENLDAGSAERGQYVPNSNGGSVETGKNDPNGQRGLNNTVNLAITNAETAQNQCIQDSGNCPEIPQNELKNAEKDVLGEQIVIRAGADLEDEIEYVTELIQRLISEKNYQYRDIAIATGDIEGYRSTVERVLGRHGIPYFIDKTQPILLNPFIEYIRALLAMIIEDYSFESVLRLLKSSLFDIETDKLDRLENYVLARGIRGKKQWHERFVNISRDEEAEKLLELEHLREEIVRVIDYFEDGLAGNPTVLSISKALYSVIATENVHRKLYDMADRFEAQGDIRLAGEYRQLYEAVMHLLESMCSLLGDEEITVREYSDLLEAGLDELRIGAVPGHSDYVQICDLTRSRLSTVKTLFVVGANDGIIPSGVSGGGLLTDMEREFLLRGDEELCLAPTAREQAYTQRLYLYMMLTKPSERLIVTYHMLSGTEAAFPSYLISTLCEMFGENRLPIRRGKRALFERISDPETTVDLLAEGLSDYIEKRMDEQDLEAYRALLACAARNPELRAELDSILRSELTRLPVDGTDDNLGRISAAVARSLYGRKIIGSVTRLETYANCAYRYFLTYGLDLKERELYSFETKDMGTLLHASLEQYSKTLNEKGYTFADIPADEMETLMDEAVDNAVASSGMAVLYSNSRYSYAIKRAKRIMRRTAEVLTYHVNKGKFTPKYFEVDFDRISDLKSINIKLSDDEYMKLRGRIDRVDVCENDDSVYVKIIDYKSGDRSLDLEAVYQGRELQLLVYLGAAMEMVREESAAKLVRPAGIFYHHIDDPLIDMPGSGDEDAIRDGIMGKLKLSGLVNNDRDVIEMFDKNISDYSSVLPIMLKKDGTVRDSKSAVSEDELNTLIDTVNAKIKELGRNILDGRIDTALEEAFAQGIGREACKKERCQYCEFTEICENRMLHYKRNNIVADEGEADD